MSTHLAEPGRAGGAPARGALLEDPPADRANEAVGLKAYLDGVAARVKTVPAAWVRCELLTLKPGDKLVRMEFVEHDAAGKKVAQVNGGCWPGAYRKISEAFAAVGLRLEAGAKVLVKVTSRLDPNYGYSVEIEDIDPSYSLGDLKARAEAIRKRLKAAGIWERNRSLRRPGDFLRVAVISPSSAAGLGDFRSTVDSLARAGLVEFTFIEAPFQTPQAAVRIVEEMRAVWKMHKVTPFCALAIIRGGGAAADLAYLIDEKLAEAVCHMPMPVITGIGHERDKNLLDEVACIALDTPSKVAEHIKTAVVGAAQAADKAFDNIVFQARLTVARYTQGIGEARAAIDRGVREWLRTAEGKVSTALEALKPDARTSLEDAAELVRGAHDAAWSAARECRTAADAGVGAAWGRVGTVVRDGIRPREREVLDARAAVLREAPRSLDAASSAVDAALRAAATEALSLHRAAEAELQRVLTLADALDPSTVLAAGYTIIRGADGAPLSSAGLVSSAHVVRAEMRDGSVEMTPVAGSHAQPMKESQP